MTNNAAPAPAATPPTPGANDALAGLLAKARQVRNAYIENPYRSVAALVNVLDDMIIALDAQTERVAALTAYKDTHHYSDEYVEALHRELVPSTETRVMTSGTTQDTTMVPFMPDATAPTRETPAPLGNTRIADEVAAEYLEAHAGEDLLADLHAAIDADAPAPGALAAAAKLPRLTKAQWEMVNTLKIGAILRRHWASRTYRNGGERGIPSNVWGKLLKAGLIQEERVGDWFHASLTDLGRRALADATPKGGER